jgi:hypothetical protein
MEQFIISMAVGMFQNYIEWANVRSLKIRKLKQVLWEMFCHILSAEYIEVYIITLHQMVIGYYIAFHIILVT